MSRILHMSLDIRGALTNRDGWKAVGSSDGHRVSKAEAREWLMDRLAEGKLVLPMGPCEGFSYETGCPGHEEDDGEPVGHQDRNGNGGAKP